MHGYLKKGRIEKMGIGIRNNCTYFTFTYTRLTIWVSSVACLSIITLYLKSKVIVF